MYFNIMIYLTREEYNTHIQLQFQTVYGQDKHYRSKTENIESEIGKIVYRNTSKISPSQNTPQQKSRQSLKRG